MIFAFRHRVQSGSNHMLSYSTLYKIDSWLGILKSDLEKNILINQKYFIYTKTYKIFFNISELKKEIV